MPIRREIIMKRGTLRFASPILFVVILCALAAAASAAAAPRPIAFGWPTSFSTTEGCTGVAAGDFNRDGKQDLLAAVAEPGGFVLLLGDGAGHFAAASVTPIAGAGMLGRVAVADFDKDGKLDFAVGGSYPHDICVLYGNGSGGFGRLNRLPVGVEAPLDPLVCSLNGDTKLDLASTCSNWYGLPSKAAVLLGAGVGGFNPVALYDTPRGPQNLTAADFDEDGDTDLAVSTNISQAVVGDGDVSILANDGTGVFGPPTSVFVAHEPRTMATADMNGDEHADLIVTCNSSDSYNSHGIVWVLLGDGHGAFPTHNGPYDMSGASPVDVLLSDFNLDGKLDVAVPALNGSGGKDVSFFAGNGDGTLATEYALNVETILCQGAVADFNGDTKPDIATGDADDKCVWVALNTTIIADTTRPATYAPSNCSVRRGRKAALKYKVTDAFDKRVAVTIKIKTLKGRVKKTLGPFQAVTGKLLTRSFTCKLAKGRYRFWVYAKDAAGNTQRRVGSNILKVR
jgi:hypothetical protein